jgi:ABC-type polysaccharide/polyol phosphate export permease
MNPDTPAHDHKIALSDLLSYAREGATEIAGALENYYVAAVFGWQDVAQRYRRSKVGAFWLTISVSVMIVTLSFLFGALFRIPLKEFLPFIAIGMILWSFISTVVSEGCTAFIEASGMILQVRLRLFTHVLRVIWRNVIIFGHNIIVVPLVMLGVQSPLTPAALLAIPGFLILLLNLSWMALLSATLCARYRDITQAVQNVMQIAFFVTPIIWMPHSVSERVPEAFLNLNPFYHLVTIVREPLLGHAPSAINWIAALALAVVGWVVTLMFFGRFGKRVAYWL